MHKGLLLLILIPFTALTVVALWQHGIDGLFAMALANSAAMQIAADLVIALLLVLVAIWRDAKAIGRNPWPWLVATVFVGSFAPLGYWLTRPSEAQ